MKKFTLSVPDDLAAEIREHQSDLPPLSEVFRSAMRNELNHLARKRQRLDDKKEDDMEALIQRLRQDKEVEEKTYREAGYDAGMLWAEREASYKALQYAAELFSLEDRNGDFYDVPSIIGNDILGVDISNALDLEPAIAPKRDDDLFNDLAREWLIGWQEGVQAVWGQVAHKL